MFTKWKVSAVAGVALVVAGCEAGKSDVADTAAATSAMEHAMVVVSQQVRDLVRDSSLNDPLAAEMVEIRGFNDEQKLPKNPAAKDWGPVARLYALRRDRTKAEFERAAGAMVAVLEVDPDGNMPNTYRHLKIENNSGTTAQVYCVFLYRTANNSDPWKGNLSKATGTKCETPTGNLIDADSVEETGYEQSADFPQYAVRFMQDDKMAPSLGVRCYNAICEIGNAKNTSHGNSSPSSGKVGKIKTWHDAQEIAQKSSGGFERGPLASITPVDGLAGMSAEFQTATGAHAATIHVFGDAPAGDKYKDWGLAKDSDTQIWLRNDVAAQRWFMQFKTGSTPTQWFEIATPRKHTAGLVPGTARWTWDPEDEGVWIACDQGCCEFGLTKKKSPGADSVPPKDSTKKK